MRRVAPDATDLYLGVATGLLGTASEALRPVIEGGYAAYGLLLLAWTGAVDWRLCGLGAGLCRASPFAKTKTGRSRSQKPAAEAQDWRAAG